MNSVEGIRSNGFCVLENLIPPEKIDAIRESVLQTVASYCRNGTAATQIGFVPGLIAVDQSYAE